MRIAQIAPLYESVPPLLYGGTERVVHSLTEELVRRGHSVTLFATADSQTRARLEPMAETGLRISGVQDQLAVHIAMLEEVYARACEFDVIHSHIGVLAFPFARASTTPTVTTLHGRLDFSEHRRVMERFSDLPMVSISHSQRVPLADLHLNWSSTVYNGVVLGNSTFGDEPSNPPYLVFLGRISPEKGPAFAIEIARRVGIKLKVAAKIDPADAEWAHREIRPLLNQPGIEYLGEVNETQKNQLLAGATALLFPIQWPEPFGMVMIESMACGTPVIAFEGGSVAEIVSDGLNGFICRDVAHAVDRVRHVGEISRAECRKHVSRHFSSSTMASGYEHVYTRLAGAQEPTLERVHPETQIAAAVLSSGSEMQSEPALK
jgi:glycosyltransferase involved in cell wall biosynthesis